LDFLVFLTTQPPYGTGRFGRTQKGSKRTFDLARGRKVPDKIPDSFCKCSRPAIATLPRPVAAFDRRYPELRNPEDCAGLCCWAAGLFADAVPGARVVYLLGSRRTFRDRVDDYPARDPFFFHAVTAVRGQAIDWTRRQLDPRARHPFIQPVAELRRDWIKLGRSAEELGL
jgi:hypothetical protein